MTDPSEILDEIRMNMKGYIYGDKGEPVKVTEPLLNPRGVSAMMGYISTVLNRSAFLSTFKEEEIHKFRDYISMNVVRDLMINGKAYGIPGHIERSAIHFKIVVLTEIALRRAMDNLERRFWRGATQESTIKVEGQGQKAGGMASILNWRRQV